MTSENSLVVLLIGSGYMGWRRIIRHESETGTKRTRSSQRIC